MIEKARAAEPGRPVRGRRPARLGRRRGDPVDVLVSNATLQWVPDHLDLLPALVARVAPGGWFAFQVPGNFDEPSHTIRTELAAEAPYAEHTAGVAVPDSHDPATTSTRWPRLGCDASTPGRRRTCTCCTGEDPVFTWVSGTGARPTLQALPDDLRERLRARSSSARLRGGVPGPRATAWCCRSGGSSWWRRCRVSEAPPRPGRLPARRRGGRAAVLRATGSG